MSNSPHFLLTLPSLSSSKNPVYLYLKGRIFYYRFRLPKSFSPEQREIRYSLHTPYKHLASKMAMSIHSFVWSLFELCKDIPREKFNIIEFKFTLDPAVKDEIEQMIAQSDKKPISLSEARKKIQGYFRYSLDKILASSEPAPLILYDEEYVNSEYNRIMDELKKPENKDLSDECEILETEKSGYDAHKNLMDIIFKIAEDYKTAINTRENFEDHYFEELKSAIEKKILRTEEITRENAEGIVKFMMLMKYNFMNISNARWHGDYLYEQQFYNDEYIPYESAKANMTNKENEAPKLKLEDLITKYIDTSIKDGKWAKRTIPDHRNRIEALPLIIGNKVISEVTRDDIRLFRDTLHNLPPRWKEKSEKENISIQDIAKIEHSQTLSIKIKQ